MPELTMSVAKLAMEDMTPLTNSQARSLPWTVFPCLTMGPIPPARTRAQIMKAMPQTGTKYDLTVKR